MRNNKIYGWDTVFRFTIRQTVKSKSYIVSTLLLAVMCFLVIIFGVQSENGNLEQDILNVDIAHIYVSDDTGLTGGDLSDQLKAQNESYKKTKVTIWSSKDDAQKDFQKMDDCADSVLIDVKYEDSAYNVQVIRTSESNIGDMNAGMFESDLYDVLTKNLYDTAQINEDQINFITSENEVKLTTIENGQTVKEQSDQTNNFMANSEMGIVIFMVMVVVLAIGGESASSSMINEKASKAIEFVLTSVRPLALIWGKVAACVVTQVMQIVVFLISGVAATYLYTNVIAENVTTAEIIADFGADKIVDNISAVRVLMAILILVGGIVFYISLAALIGSTVSKMEELSHANMIYSFILIIGAYSAMILAMTDLEQGSSLQSFLLIFPLSSPFLLPVFIISGDCSILLGIVSIIVMIICILLLMLLVAKVFETVILYNGSKVSLKMLMEFAGIKKKNAPAGRSE